MVKKRVGGSDLLSDDSGEGGCVCGDSDGGDGDGGGGGDGDGGGPSLRNEQVTATASLGRQNYPSRH